MDRQFRNPHVDHFDPHMDYFDPRVDQESDLCVDHNDPRVDHISKFSVESELYMIHMWIILICVGIILIHLFIVDFDQF